ncbi:MAG: TonB family protein [Verrucomicrobiaceae bacterium]|nr:TonB family protein [Verrucomicrobiaceae bacterium]
MKRPQVLQIEPLIPAFLIVTAMHVVGGAVVAWSWQRQHAGLVQDTLVWMSPADFINHLPLATDKPLSVAANVPSKTQQPKVEAPALPKATLIAAPAAPPMPPKPEPAPEAPASTAKAPVRETAAPLFAGAAVPKPAANRSITLRRARPPAPSPVAVSSTTVNTAPPMQKASLMDIARLNTLRPPEAPKMPATAPALEPLPPGLNMDEVDNAVNSAFYTAWTAPALDDVLSNQRAATLTISIDRSGRIIRSQMTSPSGSHALDSSILDAAARTRQIPSKLPSQFPKESYDLELNFILLP